LNFNLQSHSLSLTADETGKLEIVLGILDNRKPATEAEDNLPRLAG